MGSLLLGWVVSRTDWSGTLESLGGAAPAPYLLALAFMFGQFAISSAKWRLLLAEKGIRIKFFTLYRACMVGSFISSFLPSRYSGDLYRCYVVGRQSGRNYDSAAAVLLERAAGLFALGLVGLGASLYWAHQLHDVTVALTVAGALGGIVAAVAALFSRRLFSLITYGLRMVRAGKLIAPARKFHDAILEYRNHPATLVKVIALAALFYVESFAIMYFLLLSVGAHAPFAYLAIVVPVVYVLEALPISVNGLGVREGAFFFFLSRLGIPSEQILAFSVLVLTNRTLANLSGGVFLLTHPLEWKKRSAVKGPTAAMTAS